MEYQNGFNRPSAEHGTGPIPAPHATHPLLGDLPRMFALVQGFDDDGDGGEEEADVAVEVVAYGMTLPSGQTTTFGTNGRNFGVWNSPRSAAKRLHSDLVWLGE